MTLTFISNYINHHQIPLSNAFYRALGEDYCFIQTEPMSEERVKMGWALETDKTSGRTSEKIPYLLCAYEDPQEAKRRLLESDIVIFGGCEDQELIQPRLAARKLTFRYTERIYKEGQWKCVSPRGLKQKYHDHIRFRKEPCYLLCAGGYVASDFQLIHAYPHKMFRWGYFPEAKVYENDLCHAKRSENKEPLLLWAGRFTAYKHPEAALWLMKELKEAGYRCRLRMVGGGEMEEELKARTIRDEIAENVEFCGFLRPEQVRMEMERADIFLFTSDYREGWGAVLNESMNSGCAVIANEAIGAVPYLVRNGHNGLTYKNGDLKNLKEHACSLLENRELREQLGQRAYETIRDIWNPQKAADAFLKTGKELLQAMPEAVDIRNLELPKEGPMSRAPIQKPGFFH